MIEKSRGIVLRTVPFSETSVIARIYTEQGGLQGFIMGGVRKPGKTGRAALLQPLTLVDIVYYDKTHKGLRRLREMACHKAFRTIPFAIDKSAVAIFIAELLSLSIKEGEPDPSLFVFLEHALHILDLDETVTGLFHLHFILRLSKYLGFYPDTAKYLPGFLFNLTQGNFAPFVPPGEIQLDASLTANLVRLQTSSYETLDALEISHRDRMHLLDALVLYYELHLPQSVRLKSHRILHETLG